ncbi:PTS sugar transporter subunit IIA [Agathobaculum sp. NTUH-O15-33]|uniref:PTS sugar transporter subunit IIA n=1 Tax=Agathobaculum sp. NTUH-O15-33 TaxID=3079302 RepID=UPI0029587771|nr:PTS sugar transporter subunit IIA [Agathobaculum sp. NTUH-O15-33]WNX84549.1 PTS sugar transporter subunit IIA [Agathobaculum sp. NTUH-O15-33]
MLENITEKDIRIGVRAEGWENAIRKAAAPLLENGAIEQSYIDAMVESVHKNGPYYVLSKGLALAHARPECGVNRLALQFTTLEPGVAFGAGDNDPVRLIITLAATDNDSHLDLLGELADVLMDDGRLEKAVRSAFAGSVFKAARG